MSKIRARTIVMMAAGWAGAVTLNAGAEDAAYRVVLPMERMAYFIGETVPLAVVGEAGAVTVEAVNDDGRVLLYRGHPGALWLDTSGLAPGDYRIEVNGAEALPRLTLTSPIRRSPASLQDEYAPAAPWNLKGEAIDQHYEAAVRTLRESGLTASITMGASDMGRAPYLDTMTRAGALLLVNPETRPMSFNPPSNLPSEIRDMSRRMILTAQANGRYPNFGGFCIGWDTTGYAVGGRRGLMIYWGWGDQTPALRHYIERMDDYKMDVFRKRTGLEPVSEPEYLSYLLSIGRPDFAPAIDLPTRVWINDIARHTKAMSEAERIAFEKRLDAWSAYLMGLYREVYAEITGNLRTFDPSLRHTSSVQIDHAPIRHGQYMPSAYEPLDFQYQSTWNDQIGGPDYAWQWLLTAAVLDLHRGTKQTWLSNAIADAHHRAAYPGKFTRVAAHGLAYGVSGIGFSHEGFSNILGGMNKGTLWENIREGAGGEDVRTGRDFLDRFAALAIEGRGDHGVGILVSRSQTQREHARVGYGVHPYQALVTLTRLGCTPRLLTEEDLAEGRMGGIAALLVVGQTFPMPAAVMQALDKAAGKGLRILVDGSTTLDLPGAERLDWSQPASMTGRPHNWGSPNMVEGDNDVFMAARWHAELAPVLHKALGDVGRGLLRSGRGADACVSLMQIDAGADATYVVAVNDSHVKSQADWHQVRETLVPVDATDVREVYDCTDERRIGPLAAVECDLSETTARVYAMLKRPVGKIALQARQQLQAGEALTVVARFQDAAGRPLLAVVPFELTLFRPDGASAGAYHRATDRDGAFAMEVPLPAYATEGEWKVSLRSRLDGRTATVPVTLRAVPARPMAVALAEPVVVRHRAGIETALVRGSEWVLPVFASPLQAEMLAAAQKVRETLARRGVTVEIREVSEMGTYWLAYDPTEEQQQENARIDTGDRIGKVKRTTINGNDWYSGLMGYHFGKPLLLLDLFGVQDAKGKPAVVNPLAQDLAAKGMLWPRVDADYPGAGRAVVQAVDWAFAPERTTIIVQAADAAGLVAGAESLGALPPDRLAATVRAVRQRLWTEQRIGGAPATPSTRGLSARGLVEAQASKPFAIRFFDQRPPAAVDAPPAPPRGFTRHFKTAPALFAAKDGILHVRDDKGDFVETTTAAFLIPDLRFSEAILFPVEVAAAGKVRVVYDGQYRTSEKQPMWQAQWEDVINLRQKLMGDARQPMSIEVRLNGQPIGALVPVKTEAREVQLELASASAALKPRTQTEEIVARLEGEIELPAGRHELLLVHRNMVDGKLTAVGFGMEPPLSTNEQK